MDTPERIEEMALENLKDAKSIISANSSSVRNSRYLAGYSIELILKSKIARNLNIPNLFSKDHSKLQSAFKIHDFYQLLFYSGLFTTFESELANDKKGEFRKDWARIENWNSSWRYNIDNCSEQVVREFIQSCERFVLWIKKN